MSDEIKPERLPFDVEFFTAVDDFSTTILAKVPELLGLAIVPLWHLPQETGPIGLLRLRDPKPPHLPQLLTMMRRLVAFNAELHQRFIEQTVLYDNALKELAQEIKKKQAELDALKGATNG